MKKGFTLLEISIVLVIIGLLAGGIIAGSSLIKTAEIRSQVSELAKYDTAITTFKLKYNALPGDMANPNDFNLTGMNSIGNAWNAGFPDGNGNGILEMNDGTYPPTAVDWSEHYVFFIQLGDANLINGKYKWGSGRYVVGEQYPRLKVSGGKGGIYAFSKTDTHLAYFLGLTPRPGDQVSVFTNGVMTPEEAYSIDSKMDNGNPSTGKVFAATAPDAIDTTPNVCLNANRTGYKLASTLLDCRLVVTSAVH